MCAVVELFELCERKTENPDFHFAGKKSKLCERKTENQDFHFAGKKSKFYAKEKQKIKIFTLRAKNQNYAKEKQKIKIFTLRAKNRKLTSMFPSFPFLRDLGSVAACKQGECNSQPYFANRETDRRRCILQENQC